MTWMVIDLETENHKYCGALASPRHPENYVVAVGHCVDTGPVEGAYYNKRPENWLHIPDNVTMLVAHNAPFEMDWFLVQQYDEIMKFLSRGGRIFDTAIAEYLLSNQQDTYPALNEVAPRYGGTHKIDAVKIQWEQGALTSHIDKDLLCEYLLGPEGDIENTRKVFMGQWAALTARGMLNMALGRMEGMLANCFAMHAGLYVDQEVAFKQLEEGNAALLALEEQFKKHRNFPVFVDFKPTSDYHMSAWLFGGPIKYECRDIWYEDDGVTPKYEKADFYRFEDGTLIECAAFDKDIEQTPGDAAKDAEAAVRVHGPVDKFKSGKNKGQPKVYRLDTTTPKLKKYVRYWDCPGIIPMGLMPKSIVEAFQEEYAGNRKLNDGSPVYSTGADALEMLSKREEFSEEIRGVITSLLRFAKIDKDMGTYYLREVKDEEGNVIKTSGALQYLTPASIIHHILNNTSTVTGRLSSNRPNFQNLPRGDTSKVKAMFTSRFGANGRIVEADYKALEVVFLAAVSKDANLTRALLDGIDMHCMRLAASLNQPYDEVLLKCTDENHPEHAAYKVLRTKIKPKAFAYQYGATAAGIAFATGCTVEEAQAFIDTEKALFPEVEAYYENVIFKRVENSAHNRRETFDDGRWRLYQVGTYEAPSGTTYEFRSYPKTKWVNGQKLEVMDFKPTQMRNYPIQGESSLCVQIIAGLVIRWLISRNFFDGKALMINQVHDALYLDCHEDVLLEVASGLKQIMESVSEVMKSYGYDLGVPFPVEVEAGLNMLKKEKVNV